MEQGKYTVETFAHKQNLSRQSAINALSRLKKQGYVEVSGGGRQKRIYTLSIVPKRPTNGFYDIVNRYSPEKLVPGFQHRVIGRYTVEHAIIDGIRIGDVRTLEATMHLFRHVKDWKRLMEMAKKHGCVNEVHALYNKAKGSIRVRRMPQRYPNDQYTGSGRAAKTHC